MSALAVPGPDESDPFADAVAEVERYVAAAAPTPPPRVQPVEHDDQDTGDGSDQGRSVAVGSSVGRTGRVRRLSAEVAEAHALLALQGDTAPLLVDTGRVRRALKRSREAARLHALGRDPMARAWQAARVRLVLTVVALVALVGALGWSTTGVHHTLTMDMSDRGAAWWGAWAVEPVLSAVLLVVVAAKAFLTTRGHTLRHRHLSAVEAGALGVTLTLNVWPYLPWAAEVFAPMALLAHAIGPLVAVGAVTVMPIIWDGFARLDHGGDTPTDPARSGAADPTDERTDTAGEALPAGAAQRASAGAAHAPDAPIVQGRLSARAAALLPRLRAAIAAGDLPPTASASAIRAHLRCGSEYARELRDMVTDPAGRGATGSDGTR
ncbi:hypothetical protein [Actinokineospora enzanensis]|uniref:hypothetical protein n=1 Tax=Actinokineospora enzanensis TaxID=155975 RepID=UPI00036131B8|nr:hypothetical protein [Actinokineospora enzanensis]